jgi:hypothetical protein
MVDWIEPVIVQAIAGRFDKNSNARFHEKACRTEQNSMDVASLPTIVQKVEYFMHLLRLQVVPIVEIILCLGPCYT